MHRTKAVNDIPRSLITVLACVSTQGAELPRKDPRFTESYRLRCPHLACAPPFTEWNFASIKARGKREFSGLVLDAQQKDRELGALDVQAARMRQKVRRGLVSKACAT